MPRIFFIAVFLIGFIPTTQSQQWIESGFLDSINIDMGYHRINENLQNGYNQILGSIAYTQKKPVESVKIQWSLIASYQIFREGNGSFNTEILIKPNTPEGDLKLYDFYSAKYILPELKSFRLRIFKEDSSLVYSKQFNQNAISVSSVGQIVHFSFLHQRWVEGWYVKIDQFNFKNNTSDYTFEQWFQYTNDYKAANYFVDKQLEKYKLLQQFPQESGSFLIKTLQQLNYLQKLNKMPFYLATISSNEDPDGLKKKIKILLTLYELNIEKYRANFQESKTSQFFSSANIVNAYMLEEDNLLNMQQEYISIYDAIFQQLIKANYPSNLVYKDFNFFELLGADQTEIQKHMQAFEHTLYEKSMLRIIDLVQNQDYAISLYFIDNLESYSNQTNAFKLTDTFYQFKARAVYGIYTSFVNVVDQAIKIRNTKLALQYIDKAKKIQELYPSEIITTNLVDKKIKQLIHLHYDDYNEMMSQNRYLEADRKLDTIRELIGNFPMSEADVMLNQLDTIKNLGQIKQISETVI